MGCHNGEVHIILFDEVGNDVVHWDGRFTHDELRALLGKMGLNMLFKLLDSFFLERGDRLGQIHDRHLD